MGENSAKKEAAKNGLPPAEDFSFQIWQHIYRMITAAEKRALESGETVEFQVEVARQAKHCRESIIQVELVCEPGRPARSISIRTK